MKYSGLYFIPTPSTLPADSTLRSSALISTLETSFPALSRSAPWTLTYRLFRDTPPRPDHSDNTPQHHAHSYQHLLTHTALSTRRAYIHICPAQQPEAKTPAKGTVTSIPAQQVDARASLLRNQLAALWTPRHMLSVQNGASYTGGLFTVQIGEMRALREGQGGGLSSPGVVCCISTVAGSEDLTGGGGGADGEAMDVDFEFAQATIRELWGKIREGRDVGRAEVREVFMASETGGGSETDALVGMWCEVLKMRG